MAGTAAIVGAGAGLLGAGNSLFGGGSQGGQGYYSGSNVPPSYVPKNQPGADQNYQNLTNAAVPYATSVPNYVIPQFQQATQGIVNNPYAPQAQAGANAAAGYGAGTLAPMQGAAAGGLYGAGSAAIPYATQILQQGFDPQSALYNQQVNQLTQQLNAQNAASGISGPAAAQTVDQALTNFNLGWQNQQLGREGQAAQGYQTLIGGAGQAYGGASDLGGGALSTLTNSAALPYSTSIGQLGNTTGALGNYSAGANNAFGLDQNTVNQLATYLRLGQSGTQVAQQGEGQQFGQNMATGQNLAYALTNPALGGALGQLFGGSGGSPFGTGGGGGSNYFSDPNLQPYF